MENNNNPKVGLGVYILNDENQILLLKRIGAHGNNSWCPPGGHLEFGESFADGAKREVREETGLDIDDIKIIGVTNDIFENENKHYVTVTLSAKKFSGVPKIMEPKKCAEMRWFDLNNLPEPLFLASKNFFASNPAYLCGSGKKFNECHGK